MTLDENTFGPVDFESSFAGQPPAKPADADLVRGRRSRHRRQALGGSVVAAAVIVVGSVLAGTLSGRPVDAVPAQTVAPSSTVPASALSSPSTPSPQPSASPSQSPPSTPPRDTAPPLRYRSSAGYLDRNGRSIEADKPSFGATKKNTYTLVRAALDPGHTHLGPYEADAFTGGGVGRAEQIGQKLSWTTRGDPGEGMLLVSVSRPHPGQRAVLAGDSGMGQCAGTFADLPTPCTKTMIAGREVFYAAEPGGGFVLDYLQPDGEVASMIKDPVFGNNTDVALRAMKITAAEAVALLADPRLDVIG